MIAPVPDEAAGEPVVFVDELLVILYISGAVAHGMDVFALDERLIQALFHIGNDGFAGLVHMAVDVQHGDILIVIAAGLQIPVFVMDEAGRIVLLDPASGLLEILTHA